MIRMFNDGYMKANAILFLISIGFGLTTALLSIYLSTQGISLANIGLIFAVGLLVAGFLRVPLGVLSDCIGRKWLMVFGLIAYPLFSIGIIYSTLVAHYVLLDLMLEIMGAIFWTGHSAYLFDVFSKGREGIGLSVRNIVSYAAGGFAPIIAGIIAANMGFTNLFMISAAITALAIPVALTVQDKNGRKKFNWSVMKQELHDLKHIRHFGWIVAIIALVDFIMVFWIIFMPIWLLQQGIALEAIGVILSANILVAAIAQVPLGKAIDKFPIKSLIIPGFFFMWVGSILFFAFQNYLSYLFNRILIGTSSDMASWPAVGLMAKFTPAAEHGAATALAFGLAMIGRGLASLFGGQMTEKFGIPVVLIAVSFLALLASIALLVSGKKGRKIGTSEHKLHHWKHVNHTRLMHK